MNIVLVQENMYMNAFRKLGAISIENSKTLEELKCKHNLAFKKLVGRGVFIKIEDNKYYLDEEKAKEFIYARRRFSFYVLIVLFSILLVVFTKLQNHYETIINLTNEEKIEDFEYLWNKLNSSYPFWNEVSESGINKNDVYENYRQEIKKGNTDIEFMKTIGDFLQEFKGYGHLLALDGYMYNFYDNTFTLAKDRLNDEEIKEIFNKRESYGKIRGYRNGY